MLEILRDGAATQHTRECADAALNFNAAEVVDRDYRSFTDADFVTHCVGMERLDGEDSLVLRDADRIHQTNAPVLSEDEVEALVTEARAAMDAGVRSNFTYTREHNLGEVHVAHLPEARAWLTRRLADTFWPLLANRFGLDPSSLRVFDSLVIRYDESKGAVRQPVHRDGALLSLNVALSSRDDYEGGGERRPPGALDTALKHTPPLLTRPRRDSGAPPHAASHYVQAPSSRGSITPSATSTPRRRPRRRCLSTAATPCATRAACATRAIGSAAASVGCSSSSCCPRT